MAKIRNTKELVTRSKSHAKKDHIVQGTYGDISKNGHYEFKGCAIACLANPATQKGLKQFFKKWFDASEWSVDGENEVDLESDRMIDELKKEFGIVPELARCAEAVFEGLNTHGEAIEFIPKFAAALPEGANITPKQVEKFVEKNWETEANVGPDIANIGYVDTKFISQPGYGYDNGWTEHIYLDASEAGDRLIKWLESKKKVAK
jgi:hypothetical protein